ncbi:MAG TPA: cupin domain-containing protein [Gemmatimonadaceae bacterium]|jgi:mannose-6-phosphate isomerase-like protein (cupin superfamily)|nr:cupin domain-containing protein [Gemmatimonadaceae bacterium]
MRHIKIAPFLLVMVGSPLGAQKGDTATVFRAAGATATSPARAKREADKRRRRIDFLPASTLSANAEWLREKGSIGWTLLTSGDRQTAYVLVRRSVTSEPEVHARWDDVVIIRSGTGAIEMGDSLVASRYRAPGERMGGTLINSSRLVVRAGDLVRIPAAVPHAFVVSGTEPLEYLVIKQRRQELPIRWFAAR